MQTVNVTEPALLIRIARRYNDRMTPEALYEATRGVWRIGRKRENVCLFLKSPRDTAFRASRRVLQQRLPSLASQWTNCECAHGHVRFPSGSAK
jgi:hypothetical protein